jgi:polyhydroxyalkanoate synthase
VPGSVINALSAALKPRVQPMMDLAASLLDLAALAIHIRVARWAYDEFPLPGQFRGRPGAALPRRSAAAGNASGGVAADGDREPGAGMAVVNPVGGGAAALRSGWSRRGPAASFEVLEYESDRGPCSSTSAARGAVCPRAAMAEDPGLGGRAAGSGRALS